MTGLQVEIFGQTYVLRSEADAEHVRQVAGFLDSKMREVASDSRSVTTLQIAVLAALDIVSEHMLTEAEAKRLLSEVEARADTMAQRIVTVAPEVCM